MKSARYAVQIGIIARARAVLTKMGFADVNRRVVAHRAPDGMTSPLIIVGSSTEVEGDYSDKKGKSSDVTHTCRCYSTDATEAVQIASNLIEEVTENLQLEGFKLLSVSLDEALTQEDDDPNVEVFGEIVRFRIHSITL